MNRSLDRDPAGGGISRRSLLRAAGAAGASAGLGSLLAACGQQRVAQTQQGKNAQAGQVVNGNYPEDAAKALNATLKWPKTALPEPSSKVEITVSHAWESAFLPRQQQFDKFFMERHPNIKVTVENSAWADYKQKYVTAAAGGDLPDLMYMHFSWIQTFIRNNVFTSLQNYVAKQTDFNMPDFTKPSMTPFKKDGTGEIYGVPYDCGPLMLFYNKDILAKSGISNPDDSWTMDKLKSAALTVAKNGGGKVWGMSAGPTPANPDLAPPWLMPFGADYVNDTQTACTLNSPKAIQTMQYWQELNTAKAVPTAAQALNVQPDPFTAGRAGFALNGTWATPSLQADATFKWAMAKWPKGPITRSTAAEGSAYAITQSSKQQDAAWIYLNEYTSEPGMNFMWASTGRGSPARSSAWKYYTESDLAAPGADEILPTLNQFGSANFLFLPQTTEALNTASPIWDQMVAGKLDVTDGCNKIASALTPILAKNAA